MSVILMSLAALASESGEPVVRTLPVDMPGLRIVGASAEVIIRQVEGTTSRVVITPLRWWEGCAITFTGDRQQAIASIEEEGEPGELRCKAQIEVELAGSSDVAVELDRGQVLVESLYGDLTATLTAGRVTGAVSGEAAVALRRGWVVLHGLQAPVQADVGVGRISLMFEEATAGTVSARVGLGRIQTAFPYGALVDLDANTTIGRMVQTIPAHTAAVTRLEARAGVGRIAVEADLNTLMVEEPAPTAAQRSETLPQG